MTNQPDEPAPGVVRWLISCDESGTDGSRHYGFGTLWMSWQRRGDFFEMIRNLREHHQYPHEIKWTHVKGRSLDFYEDLVEEFFRVPWLSFHCCIVEKALVRKELHGGDYDLARRKHFGMLLTNKIRAALRKNTGREQTFRVLVDPIHSRYAKADEASEVICNRALEKALGVRRPVDRVLTRDSKDTPSIQLCDLLLGATRAAVERDATSEAKLDLQSWIAHHLGWPDLNADTFRTEKKFNVWIFHDPTRAPRRVQTRHVQLRYPLPR